MQIYHGDVHCLVLYDDGELDAVPEYRFASGRARPNKIGLDDEQKAIYEQMNDTINSQKRAASFSKERDKALGIFRKLEGRWKFVDGNAG